ncbi:nucleotidyltransferase [Corallococcus sp. AB030]|uniref:nucleotidyltransferase domain-containing protein n=1 Tax=Corallococcus sp. AB030 TaxID=2316716 RepID=UPI000EE6F88B|nr:nucleotidyltransferase [Corallococcus sp. AB030]RKH97813.1 nucleotidyltransferase [Corallococcus sp. AB030]
MAKIQTQIEQFDSNIRLKRFDENKMLREKRDAILNRLREKFAALRKEGKEIPSFDTFNQGSYQMGTGIQPADGDYDIDVGVRFNCASTKYPNPVTLKITVADALEGHTEIGTDIRRSCVTVYYKLNGEQAYHVDLAVYTYDNPESPGLSDPLI